MPALQELVRQGWLPQDVFFWGHQAAGAGLGRHTVDTNPRCRRCAVRYLCGGVCRAWAGGAGHDLDAPVACGGLEQRAWQLVGAALSQVRVTAATWKDAGLPWAERNAAS